MSTPLALPLSVAALAAVGLAAGVAVSARPRQSGGSPYLSIVTPVIDLGVAELVLSALDRLTGDDVTVLLHTQGGCVASCVMIAQAVARFSRSKAVVPYFACSGGALIALAANSLEMGGAAYLSAVDPLVYGERARYLIEASDVSAQDSRLRALAKDYEGAVGRYITTVLRARVSSEDDLNPAYEAFMGLSTPHDWPISAREVAALGIPVGRAERHWSDIVNRQRHL